MSTLKLDTIASRGGSESTDVTNVINGSAKAWVSLNGTGTISIYRSFNVSSITDAGTGTYTINMANPMEDGYYAVAASFKYTNSGTNNSIMGSNRYHDSTDSTTSFTLFHKHTNGTLYDCYIVSAIVFS